MTRGRTYGRGTFFPFKFDPVHTNPRPLTETVRPHTLSRPQVTIKPFDYVTELELVSIFRNHLKYLRSHHEAKWHDLLQVVSHEAMSEEEETGLGRTQEERQQSSRASTSCQPVSLFAERSEGLASHPDHHQT